MKSRLVLACSLLMAACAGPPEDALPDDAPDDSGYVNRVVVSEGPDGKPVVHVDQITPAAVEQMKLQRAARLRVVQSGGGEIEEQTQALTRDGCPGSSLWMFDKPNLDPTSNVLCVSRTLSSLDADWLGNYFRKQDKGVTYGWQGAVRSFWAGDDPGYFRLGSSPFTAEPFGVMQQTLNVSGTVAGATVIALYSQFDQPHPTFTATLTANPCPARVSISVVPQHNFGAAGIYAMVPQDGSSGPGHCSYRQSDDLAAVQWGETYRIASGSQACFFTRNDFGAMEGSSNPPTGPWNTANSITLGTCRP